MRAYRPNPATKMGTLWREIGLPASRGTILVDSIKMGFSVDVIDSIHYGHPCLKLKYYVLPVSPAVA